MISAAGDIARALGERIDTLASQLLPGGRRDGRLWRCGSIAGEAGQSFVVALAGPKRGRWFEFNGHTGGDALDLIAQSQCHGDISNAINWARGWLGWGELDPKERDRIAQRARDTAAKRDQEAGRERIRRQQDAKALWLAALPLAPDDLIWRYLLGRGIDLTRLLRLPGALRTHPNLFHRKSGSYYPAMVAAIAAPDGAHVATQRTWLELRDDGSVTKAPLGPDAKMSLGPFRHSGGAVHLTRGHSGKPWKDAPPGDTVAVAEGIEDALSFAILRPDLRVAACATSLAYLATIALPPQTARVIVIGQNDPRGSDAMRAQKRGIDGLRAKGIRVAICRPPVCFKDINDYLQWLSTSPAELSVEEAA